MADILIDEVLRLASLAIPIPPSHVASLSCQAHSLSALGYRIGQGDVPSTVRVLMLNAGSGLLPWALAEAGAQVVVSQPFPLSNSTHR